MWVSMQAVYIKQYQMCWEHFPAVAVRSSECEGSTSPKSIRLIPSRPRGASGHQKQ